jgi:carbamate kinase
VHGNGPQVGNLAIQQEAGLDLVPAQPLHSLGAMSQGQLGSALVLTIDSILGPGSAVAVVSHMTVEPGDPAFETPTKPIGPFFSTEQSGALAADRGWIMREDSGRGYRRVVPSPRPGRLLEDEAVAALLADGRVVLAGGGGGVAVTTDASGRYRGVEAVIDKDAAAARIAGSLKADALILVTGVDAVSIDFGTPQARVVRQMSIDLDEKHLDIGQFPAGSMGPKVRAAIDFVRSSGGTTVITSAEHLLDAMDPAASTGTRIVASSVMSPA